MDFRNYSSVMAIVAGLGSSPIRRLRKTWEGISKQHMELYRNIDTIMDTRVRKGISEETGRSLRLTFEDFSSLVPLTLLVQSGHSQILSCSCGENSRFYLVAVERKLPSFLHSCEIKSGSGLGMRLAFRHKTVPILTTQQIS